MFEPLPPKFSFPEAEKRVLAFWDAHDVFAASIAQRKDAERFVFYEGPPTANGMPHPGHALTRAMKDIFPRYQTMCGRLVERKGGWDTHGLPVEREVCKELGLRTKQDIEAYGVEKFNLKCIQSVFRYTREWEEMTRRLAYWVDLKDAYVTYHQSYIESVWWSLKTLFERGVLYQGHKVVWWWAQGGTALSSGEVGEGYKTVDDPSVFVKFPLVKGAAPEQRGAGILPAVSTPTTDPRASDMGGQNARPTAASAPPRTSLLVWTTTPWTLISNHFAAVHPELEYALVHDPVDDEYLYVASALVEVIAKKVKRELRVVSTCKGSELVAFRYVAPFDCYYGRATRDVLAKYSNDALRGVAKLHSTVPLGDAVSLLVNESRDAGNVRSDHVGWRALAGDFVTIESGTGIVHEAPPFGDIDFSLWKSEAARFAFGLPLLNAVNPDGSFNSDAPERYRGRWVKDCDKDIIRELRDERKTPWGTPLLYHQEQYRHEYPFCPQSPDDPLIQYPRAGWFVRTSAFKDEFLANNATVNWLPGHIKEGRFGDFLRNNVDWALSRERYWGTPLPIWKCDSCGKMEALGSFAELQSRPGATDGGYWERKVAEHKGEEFPEHLRVHKPYIDEWTYDSPFTPGARMRRVPDVIDCWWDAGSMPFAQWGFPHAPGSVDQFFDRFPADFISEAIDQTRGWFYALMAINTLLFSERGANETRPTTASGNREAGSNRPIPFRIASTYPLPFQTCIVLGHIAGEDGNKMSKKLRNYKEPSYIFDSYGADAMRWYFFSAQAPWTSVRFQETAIRDAQREFLVKLYNVLSFFTIYANIDGFDPRRRDDPGNPMAWRPTEQRGELDRWVVTELHRTVREVRAAMDRFENYPAAQALNEFVEALSNWYVRRSRDRFWRGVKDQDKWDAYHTLYGCLLTTAQLIAPFTPFFAEMMYQVLTQNPDAGGSATKAGDPFNAQRMFTFPRSVHLCDYPRPEDIRYHDDTLSEEMDMVREIASLGRAARAASTVKEAKRVRQPLARVEVILANGAHAEWLESHKPLIAEELNVKTVEFTSEADQYVTYKVQPNFAAIGKKYRALVPGIKAALAALRDAGAARKTLVATGTLPLTVDGQTVDLTSEEVEIRLEARPGWSAVQGRVGVVVLSSELTVALREEGLVREFIHHVQVARKEQNLAYEARVTIHVDGPAQFLEVLKRFEEFVRGECLADSVALGAIAGGVAVQEIELEAVRAKLGVAPRSC